MNILSALRLDSLGRSSSTSSLNTSIDEENLDDIFTSIASSGVSEDEEVQLAIEIHDGRYNRLLDSL